MPQPTRSDVHVNRPLTNISIAYIQRAQDFIADKLFPNVPVMKQADRYFSYDKEFWFRTGAEKRAPATESAGGGFKIDNTPSYFCDPWAHHMDVDDQTRANADQPLDMDRDATLFVTQNLLLRRELQFHAKYFKTGVWQGLTGGGDFTPGTLWSAAGADPMKDVDILKASIKAKTGFMPNTLAVANNVFFALRNCPAVLDRIKYTQRGVITEDLLAQLFGVDKFLVSSGVVNTAAEGAASANQFIADKAFLLCYANPSPSILQPSAGYIFSWQGLYGAGAQGNRVSSFRMEHLKADRIEGEMAFDMKIIGADLGVLGTAVIA